MKLIEGKVRSMREELARAGTPADTDEIRISMDMDGVRSVITLQPPNYPQNEHKHLLAKEAVQVMQGQTEAYGLTDVGYEWFTVKKNQLVEFGLNEYHNIKTGEITEPISYENVPMRIAAVTMAYRFVPPYIKLEKGEAEFLFDYDWFGQGFDEEPADKKKSPLLRADSAAHKKFMEILQRNKYNVGYDTTDIEKKLNKVLYAV